MNDVSVGLIDYIEGAIRIFFSNLDYAMLGLVSGQLGT